MTFALVGEELNDEPNLNVSFPSSSSGHRRVPSLERKEIGASSSSASNQFLDGPLPFGLLLVKTKQIMGIRSNVLHDLCFTGCQCLLS